jgi:hypothetical protein
LVDQVIDGDGQTLDDDHCDAESERRADFFRDGQERAHTEEKRQRQILDEDRFNKQIDQVHYEATSGRGA